MNSPSEIANIYVSVGIGKTRPSFLKMFVLGCMAGAFIAFGALGSSVASCGIQPAALSRVLSAAVFPIGLMMVLCAGSELFTGNCLVIIPVLTRRIPLKDMLLGNWLPVYLGNLAGSMVVAALVVFSHTPSLYGGALAQAMVSVASAKVHINPIDAVAKGILCNFMVCIAVWISFGAKDSFGKIAGPFLPIFLFVLCGFEHCVANMYFIPVGILASWIYNMPMPGLNWLTFVAFNLLPVTVGNIIGGCGMVGCIYWYVYLKGRK